MNKMEIPRFRNGFVKSMTFSRAELMVMDPTAKSDFCNSERERVEFLAENWEGG